MMKFNGNFKRLKSLGFTFQKMYAGNHKCYHINIEHYSLWIWVNGCEIEFEDLYSNTNNFFKFFKENRHLYKSDDFLSVYLNVKTGEIERELKRDEFHKLNNTTDSNNVSVVKNIVGKLKFKKKFKK